MTTDDLKALGISESECYTYSQVAEILKLKPPTVGSWCRYGLRTKRHGIVVLSKFNRGRLVAIKGKDLIDFLQRIQNNN